MNGSKSIFTSTTFWGAAVVILAASVQPLGFTFGADDQGATVGAITNIVEGVGALIAIVGRIRATKIIA